MSEPAVASLGGNAVAYRGGFPNGFGSWHPGAESVHLSIQLPELTTVSGSLLCNLFAGKSLFLVGLNRFQFEAVN